MSDRINIDRLFQEKFKDFEVSPPDSNWDKIQHKMNQKEQEKEINFLAYWLKLCGSVAAFFIIFSVVTTLNNFNYLRQLLNTNHNTSKSSINTSISNSPNSVTVNKQGLETAKTKNTLFVVNNSSISAKALNQPTKSNTYLEEAPSKQTMVIASFPQQKIKSNIQKQGLRNAVSGLVHTKSNSGFTNVKNLHPSQKDNMASLPQDNNPLTGSKSTSENNTQASDPKNNSLNTNIAFSSQTLLSETFEALAINEEESSEKNEADFDPYSTKAKVAYEVGNEYVASPQLITKTTFSQKLMTENPITESNRKPNLGNGGNSSFMAAQANQEVTDSLGIKKVEAKEIATEEKSNEVEKKEKIEKKSKWIVSSIIAPIYMNLNGSGSALDTKFAENSKSYQTSLSYGMGLKYALNKKWSVRTGVNVLNFEYSTNGITYFYSTTGSGLENVNENGNGSGVVIENPNPKGIAYDENGIVTKRYTGNLSHSINYVEIPMELSYKVLNKNIGIDLIGGMSSLLLNNNSVSILSTESNINIGKANNLNKVHLSTNIGLGVHYRFMKNLQAIVEPMLKYQWNTYNGNSGNFRPYFLGVYSGISYSF